MLETLGDALISTPAIGAATAANEDADMGKVVVEIELVNVRDDELFQAGYLKAEQVRRVKIPALVDTGASILSLPIETIQALGLTAVKQVQSHFANGQTATRKVYGKADLRLMGRSWPQLVLEGHKGVPALLGQIPLETLDLMVDSFRKRLVPAHPEAGDMPLYECY